MKRLTDWDERSREDTWLRDRAFGFLRAGLFSAAAPHARSLTSDSGRDQPARHDARLFLSTSAKVVKSRGLH